MRTTRARCLLGAVVLLGVSLGGCTTSPEDIEIGDGIAPTVEGADGGAQPPGEDGAVEPGPSRTATTGSGAVPAPGSCTEIPAAGDGVYTVGDAGIVTVTVAESTLALAAVEPFAGWEYEVGEDEPGKVEVELRKNGQVLDLKVEVDDGEVVAEVCADDD